jgi:hypothetical protein
MKIQRYDVDIYNDNNLVEHDEGLYHASYHIGCHKNLIQSSLDCHDEFDKYYV